jgi:hypothetical protein
MQALRRPLSLLALAAALGAASHAFAQASAPAPVDAEKQKLVDRVLTLWHPETIAVVMVQRPAGDAMEKSAIALQTAHVPRERIDATMKDIATDVQKYVDTATPVAVASARRNVGPTVGPLLARNFSVDELRQLIAMLESPVKGKFEKFVPQMETAIGQKVQADIGAEINQDIQAMTQAVGTKLRVAATLN